MVALVRIRARNRCIGCISAAVLAKKRGWQIGRESFTGRMRIDIVRELTCECESFLGYGIKQMYSMVSALPVNTITTILARGMMMSASATGTMVFRREPKARMITAHTSQLSA